MLLFHCHASPHSNGAFYQLFKIFKNKNTKRNRLWQRKKWLSFLFSLQANQYSLIISSQIFYSFDIKYLKINTFINELPYSFLHDQNINFINAKQSVFFKKLFWCFSGFLISQKQKLLLVFSVDPLSLPKYGTKIIFNKVMCSRWKVSQTWLSLFHSMNHQISSPWFNSFFLMINKSLHIFLSFWS